MFSGLVKGIGRVASRTNTGADARFVVELGSCRRRAARGRRQHRRQRRLPHGGRRHAGQLHGRRIRRDAGRHDAGPARRGCARESRAAAPGRRSARRAHRDGPRRRRRRGSSPWRPSGTSKRLVVAVATALARYIAPKGSVTVDGVSLTVNAVGAAEFEVNIIPHTQSVTVIGEYGRGTAVNIEVDMLARYLERFVQTDAGGGVDLAFLRKHGYARDHR